MNLPSKLIWRFNMDAKMERLINSTAFAMNGQTVEIAKHKEVWAKLEKEGTSFPVAKVIDHCTNTPFLWITLVDYEGKMIGMEKLTYESADALYGEIIDILY